MTQPRRRMTQPRLRRSNGMARCALIPIMGLLAAGCGGAEGDGGEAAGAAAGESCYSGEALTMVVSYGAGGGYDMIARAAAPYLKDELGATAVVVENQEGAGGLTAANRIFTEDADGMTVGFFSGQGLVGSVLGGSAGAGFDVGEFSYIARVAEDPRVLTVGAKSGFKTVEDLQEAGQIRFASAGPGGSDHIDQSVLFPVLGIDAKVITGYKGSSETELAVTSGDADAAAGTLGTRLSAIKSGDHLAVLLIGEERAEEIPDTPALLELDLDDDKRALAEAHTKLQKVGRAVLGPPGMPEDCVVELGDAMKATLENDEFLATMKKSDQGVSFLPGDELKQVVQSVLDAPADYKELLKAAYQGQ